MFEQGAGGPGATNDEAWVPRGDAQTIYGAPPLHREALPAYGGPPVVASRPAVAFRAFVVVLLLAGVALGMWLALR